MTLQLPNPPANASSELWFRAAAVSGPRACNRRVVWDRRPQSNRWPCAGRVLGLRRSSRTSPSTRRGFLKKAIRRPSIRSRTPSGTGIADPGTAEPGSPIPEQAVEETWNCERCGAGIADPGTGCEGTWNSERRGAGSADPGTGCEGNLELRTPRSRDRRSRNNHNSPTPPAAPATCCPSSAIRQSAHKNSVVYLQCADAHSPAASRMNSDGAIVRENNAPRLGGIV